MPSTVVVIGGGKVGAHLGGMLRSGGHPVHIVEESQERVARLEATLEPGVVVVAGSGTDGAVLERAGIRTCDVVAAVTGNDETNLVAGSLARFEFGVPRVIARVVDPRNAWMYGADMGIDVALDQGDLLAHLVTEEMSLGEMTTLLKLRRGRYSLVEERVDPESNAAGRTVAELRLPPGCLIVGVIRGGDLLPVTGPLELLAADEVLAVVHADHIAGLVSLLGAPSVG